MTDIQEHDIVEPSLYVRIGGADAVAAAVDGLYERIVADRELQAYFVGVEMERLKVHQRAFIASALGGPARYQGRRLDDAHRRLDITPAAFAKVAAVIDAVGSLRPQVVSRC